MNPTTIVCDTPACTQQFPVTRDLFNVYSNGSFGSTTAANQAIADPNGYCQVWTTDGDPAP